jgi:hypothetical protein
MIGSRRKDSSTIRATPSASGEQRSNRNFSINSSARFDEVSRAEAALGTAAAVAAFPGIVVAPSFEIDVVASRSSRDTPSAREIRLKVPA